MKTIVYLSFALLITIGFNSCYFEPGETGLHDVIVRSGNQQARTVNGKFILTGEVSGGDTSITLFFSKQPVWKDTNMPVHIPSGDGNILKPLDPDIEVVMQSN